MDIELKSKHPDLFRYIDEVIWDENIQKLKSDVHKLSDLSIRLRISQIISSIKDGHTSIDTLKLLTPIGYEIVEPQEVFEFPIRYEYFEDELRVISCKKEYEDILGYKLVAINNIEVKELIDRLSTLVHYDNSQSAKERVKKHISIYEYLKFLEIVNNNEAEYLFENDKEEIISMKITTLKNKDIEYVDLNKKESKISKEATTQNDFYWYKIFEEDNILYFKFDKIFTRQQPNFGEIGEEEYPDYYEFHNKLMNEIDKKNFKKLVIDLRDNPGGYIPLVEFVTHELKYKSNLEKEDIFVITGKRTASAAADLAWQLQGKDVANIIGEETGGNVNYFSTDGEVITLPNSKLDIRHSSEAINNSTEHDGGVKPDIYINQSYKSYISGVDDCYEYIKEYN